MRPNSAGATLMRLSYTNESMLVWVVLYMFFHKVSYTLVIVGKIPSWSGVSY